MLNGYCQIRVGAQRNYELLRLPHSYSVCFYRYAGGECVVTCLVPTLSLHKVINSYTAALFMKNQIFAYIKYLTSG